MDKIMDIDKLSQLARMNINKEEKENLKKDLEPILDYVKQLNEVNVDGVEDLTHTLNVNNELREDIESKEKYEDVAGLLDAVPNKDRGYVRVKKVL